MFFPTIFYELLELILLRFSYEIKPKMLRIVQARPLQLAKPRAMVKEIFFRYPSLQLSNLVSEHSADGEEQHGLCLLKQQQCNCCSRKRFSK